MNACVVVKLRDFVHCLISCDAASILNAGAEALDLGLKTTETISGDRRVTISRYNVVAYARTRAERQSRVKVNDRRTTTLRIKPILKSIPIASIATLTGAVDRFKSIAKALFRH